MKTLSATPGPHDRWKADTLSFLHVLLVWGVKLASLLNKRRQTWTLLQKPSIFTRNFVYPPIKRYVRYYYYARNTTLRPKYY